MRTALFLALAMLVPLCLAGDSSEAPFKHPRAVQAWNRYKFREGKAKEVYEREVAAAKTEYMAGLKEAASLAVKSGDAGEVKAISEAMEGNESVKSPLSGTWLIQYANNASRKYEITPNGITVLSASGVRGEPDQVSVVAVKADGDSLFVEFTGNKAERITFTRGVLFVEHFNPAPNFPDRFATLGRGTRAR